MTELKTAALMQSRHEAESFRPQQYQPPPRDRSRVKVRILRAVWLRVADGAPLRLVAPGRRGFQWVKWVEAVEVRAGPDPGQWSAIFTSGLAR